MIYCVIATDKETGNEWVMPKTAETIVDIGAILDECRENDPRFDYRLDLVQSRAEHYHRRFTAQELFPPAKSAGLDCQECGAYVKLSLHVKHAEWHNKIADLNASPATNTQSEKQHAHHVRNKRRHHLQQRRHRSAHHPTRSHHRTVDCCQHRQTHKVGCL